MFKYGSGRSMRVVGGDAKGRRLKGTISPGGRPTTERVRAAIFNILSPQHYQGGRVLDLYAGSGSLGIEALSRGASWADFVEQDRPQCAVIQDNLETTKFRSNATVHCSTVHSALKNLVGPYQLVMLDPPYKLENLDEVLEEMAGVPDLVDLNGTVVVGHSKRVTLQPEYGPLQMISHRSYGDNVVDFYEREG